MRNDCRCYCYLYEGDYWGSNFLKEKLERGRGFSKSHNYKVAELVRNLLSLALWLVLLPHATLEMTGPRTGPRQLRKVFPDPSATSHSCSNPQPGCKSATPPLPLWLVGLTYSDGPKHRDNSKPKRSDQEMRESWSTGEPSQEVQTKQRPVPSQRPPRLLQAHPVLCTRQTQPPSGPLTLWLSSWWLSFSSAKHDSETFSRCTCLLAQF